MISPLFSIPSETLSGHFLTKRLSTRHKAHRERHFDTNLRKTLKNWLQMDRDASLILHEGNGPNLRASQVNVSTLSYQLIIKLTKLLCLIHLHVLYFTEHYVFYHMLQHIYRQTTLHKPSRASYHYQTFSHSNLSCDGQNSLCK